MLAVSRKGKDAGNAALRDVDTDFCGDEKNRLFLAAMTRQSFQEMARTE
jgi:hypothetical protein